MCLFLSKPETARLRKLKNRTITAYKAWYISPQITGKLFNLHVAGAPLFSANGIIRANRRNKNLTKYENRNELVLRGIHVYLKPQFAPGLSALTEKITEPVIIQKTRHIFPITCNLDDLIGANFEEAVFMKITVNPEFLAGYSLNMRQAR